MCLGECVGLHVHLFAFVCGFEYIDVFLIFEYYVINGNPRLRIGHRLEDL